MTLKAISSLVFIPSIVDFFMNREAMLQPFIQTRSAFPASTRFPKVATVAGSAFYPCMKWIFRPWPFSALATITADRIEPGHSNVAGFRDGLKDSL
jgi:hypothetical protein